jgi:hypothetical protein
MGNSIEAVVNKILQDYENIILEATREAAHKGQEDVMKEAEQYLQEYYKWQPRMYKRTHRLKHAMSPYNKEDFRGNSAFITIGVEYDSGALQGFYKSNSKWHQSGDVWRSVRETFGSLYSKSTRNSSPYFSSDFGVPEPDWILDNYLQGEHGGYHRDAMGTADKMNKFIDNELPSRIEGYMQSAIIGALKSRM